jgi:hypothetical protein
MRARVIGRLGLLALVGVSLAAVHGAVLKSSMSSVEAGRVLPLQGAEFHPATFSLVLVGVFGEYALGDVVVGESGTFSIDLEISASLRAGQYQVVAFNPEGEREAALDMSVAAASAVVEADPADAGGHAEAMGVEATAEEMVIERSMAGAGWGVIGLFIGLAGGLGGILVRRTPVTLS